MHCDASLKGENLGKDVLIISTESTETLKFSVLSATVVKDYLKNQSNKKFFLSRTLHAEDRNFFLQIFFSEKMYHMFTCYLKLGL